MDNESGRWRSNLCQSKVDSATKDVSLLHPQYPILYSQNFRSKFTNIA